MIGGLNDTSGGTITLTGSNNYGSAASGAGAAVNGSTIIRNGTILFANGTSLGNATKAVELGDATYRPTFTVGMTVHTTVGWATDGRSVLKVQNTNPGNADGVAGLGGAFVANGDGTRNGDGTTNTGPGAFYNISTTINGHSFVAGELILVKDETEYPERNGVYRVVEINALGEEGTVRGPTGTMNIVRVAEFDQASEMLYGTQVTVANGGTAGNAGTYFMASANVTTVNDAGSPSLWLAEKLNPDVALYATAGITLNNPLDVNANGTGTTTVGTTTNVTATFAGAVTLQNVKGNSVAETKTLTLESATTTGQGVTFSGVISEANGVGGTPDILSIIKSGAGQVTMTGLNTYHGTTVISAGNLQVGNAGVGQTGTGNVTVNGASAILSGSGTVQGATTVTQGSVRPGDLGGNSTGTLNFSNGLTYSANTTTIMQISGATGADRDLINVTGTLVLNTDSGIQVVASNGFVAQTGVNYTWDILDWTILNNVSGFSAGTNLRTGGTGGGDLDLFDISSAIGSVWDISQFLNTDGTGGRISIVAVPEPGRMLLLFLGLAALISRRRRPSSIA